MRQRRRWVTALVLTFALALVAGCSGSWAHTTPGVYTVYVGEPQNALIPGNTNETNGGNVIDALFAPLVTFDDETLDPTYDGVAESVTSDDRITWTVKLKPGWTFHDGSPVTAESYVKAWNWNALASNSYVNAFFFANIVGYTDLQSMVDGKPRATEMSGLQVVDEQTFTVTLKAPFAVFPITLGARAFSPLPEVFYDDPAAFGRKPIGNGPFTAETEWTRGRGMTLARFDDYQGGVAKAPGMGFRVYTEQSTGYTDVLAGSLDIMVGLPEDARGSAPATFEDRYLTRASSSITSLGFPLYDPRYADVRVRRAISMAINRELLADIIFDGSVTPAHGFATPVVDGFRPDPCGQWCSFDPETANKLLDEAGFDRSKPIDLWFNAGSGHDQWMLAVGNMLRRNLGVDFQLRGHLQFAQLLPLQDEKGMTGPFRAAWSMVYPSIQYYLNPRFGSAAQPPNGSNTSFYSSADFDAAIVKADGAESIPAANTGYQAAEDVLVTDLPQAPIFIGVVQAVHTTRVTNVKITPFGGIDYAGVELLEDR
ncbi:putative ABC transporter substrate-binding protein [Microlunatus phosphovorus NM-1]|uniref:Putative ABC transporter substrate-binding protein n=1 Tax=Microlunatus phosphovorus (strain ATCC 700054 / DSM 10555 / JCM 9379 / NBRC 101784 / NCIMB 13414 / VKM Ac-1990 / NM-1) TaxID=1032480 RepID=F5XPS8_MICPN|nr:ABC transporter substrate-binding protein [Microlunatus phosphovorus]BAK34386.1 putative ABC transporter substrate-binding protein [Microlunatus phosphovorus NM-1]